MVSNKTKKVIASMLKENTGGSMLDSGGTPQYDADGNYTHSLHGYGRAYERNQSRDFDREMPYRLSFEYGYISYRQNLYHYLCERLELHDKLDREFDKFVKLADEHEDWHSLADRFMHYLHIQGHTIQTGIYPGEGEAVDYKLKSLIGDKPIPNTKAKLAKMYAEYPEYFTVYGEPFVDNSYNSDNNLSQDIEFRGFYCDDWSIIVLQVHNGADARGGYTRPRVFSGAIDELLLGQSDATIFCQANGHTWRTDDAYHWYREDENGPDLRTYKIITSDDESYDEVMERVNAAREMQAMTEGQPVFEGMEAPDYSVDTGVIWVDDNGVGHCPICGGALQ